MLKVEIVGEKAHRSAFPAIFALVHFEYEGEKRFCVDLDLREFRN